MKSIQTFNYYLNQSEEDRFTRWSNYRESLTKYIIDSLDLLRSHKTDCLIVGAGNCDDIDLKRLFNITKNLTISDIDENALIRALKKYQLHLNKIDLQIIDYTGLDNSLVWDNLFENFHQFQNETIILDTFKEIKTISNNYHCPFSKKYQCIILSPIYTQLLYPQITILLQKLTNLVYPQNLLNLINDQFLIAIVDIIHNFNKNIIKALESNGLAIVISDIFETNITSKEYLEIKKIVNNNLAIEKYLHNYQEKYGFGLGDYGLEDMKKSLETIQFKWFEWQFSKEKSLFVKVEIFRKG